MIHVNKMNAYPAVMRSVNLESQSTQVITANTLPKDFVSFSTDARMKMHAIQLCSQLNQNSLFYLIKEKNFSKLLRRKSRLRCIRL